MSGDEKMSSSNATPSAHVGKPTATESGEGSGAMNELLDCPFCGERNAIGIMRHPASEGFSGVCEVCGSEGPRERSDLEAIAAWNLRATPPSPDGWQEETRSQSQPVSGSVPLPVGGAEPSASAWRCRTSGAVFASKGGKIIAGSCPVHDATCPMEPL
jgi:Lar family restriction alleviation protein